MKKTVLSGVQPSGMLSLGNYLGAIRHFVSLQNGYDAFYCIVDLHAITVRQDPQALRENSYRLAAWFLAAGLEPEHCALFVQSHVSAHCELGWILSTFTQMGELERMTQFKDKADRHRQNINAGLFTYPSLMAADILLYQTDKVPVGHDQKQHLELTRDVALRFNNIYGDIFTVPAPMIAATAARVKDLQNPEKKMSKSEAGGGTIFLDESPKSIEKKIKRAVTDNEARIAWDEARQPGVSNLLGIYAACKGLEKEAVLAHFEGQQYGFLKGDVAAAVLEILEPVQARYQTFMGDKAQLDALLKTGAEKARVRAEKTLGRVKDALGLIV